MKSMVGMLKSSFVRRLAFVVAICVVAIASTSCKHDAGGGKKPKPQKIDVVLASVKVDGAEISVANEMNASSTINGEVDIEFATQPSDAVLTFEPAIAIKDWNALEKKGKWSLNMGDNSLKIKVTKNSNGKEYTLKIKRDAEEEPSKHLLKSISVDGHKKEKDAIVLASSDEESGVIEIPVPTKHENTDFEVKYEIPEGATIEFDPELDDNKLHFRRPVYIKDFTKKLTVTVKKGDVEEKYNLKVIMMSNIAGFLGARHKGKLSDAEVEDIRKVLYHEPNVKIPIYGDNAEIIIVSQVAKWKTCIINDDKDALKALPPDHKFKGFGQSSVPLTFGGETKVKIVVSNSEWDDTEKKFKSPWLATEEFEFIVVSPNDKADAFINSLTLNNENITNEKENPNSFTNLFKLDAPPEFETGSVAKINVELSREVESVKIGDTTINTGQLTTGKDQYGLDAWFAEAKVPVDQTATPDTPKEVEIIVTPRATDTTFYEVTRMKLSLVYNEPPKLTPTTYDINGLGYYYIPQGFKDAVANGKNPSYKVENCALIISLAFPAEPEEVSLKIDGAQEVKVSGDQIKNKETLDGMIWEATLIGVIDATEKQVNISFKPKDVGGHSNGKMEFKIRGTANKLKLNPKFESISDDQNLSKEKFLDKLTSTDENEYPEYKVEGNDAEVFISLPSYDWENLVEEVQVDGVKTEFNKKNNWLAARYELKKKIAVTSEAKTVEIKFLGKDGIAEELTWHFKLSNGGTKPALPQSQIKLSVQGNGRGGLPFTDEFNVALYDGKEPTIEVYGKDVEIMVSSNFHEYIGKASFKIDDKDEVEKDGGKIDYTNGAKHTFENVSVNEEHKVVVVAKPKGKATDKYGALEIKFKVKVLDEKPSPDYVFSLNGEVRGNGYKGIVDNDVAQIIFQTQQDVVGEVKIGKKGSTETVGLTSFTTSAGKTIYEAKKEVVLSTTTTQGDDIEIEVIPKDTESYASVKCAYKLQGTAIDDDNASFVIQNGKIAVSAEVIKWKDKITGSYSDDYGAEKIRIDASVMHKEAKVTCYPINPLTYEKMQNLQDVVLGGEQKREKTGEVSLFTDKPTLIKAEVTAKDNVSKDELNGVWTANFNPVPLYWSYKEIKKPTSRTKKGYDEIKVSKAKLRNGKVYFFFIPWGQDLGYKVGIDAVEEGQSKFENLGKYQMFQHLYRTSLDVSSLQVGHSKNIKCKIIQIDDFGDEIGEAMTYQVKITMED